MTAPRPDNADRKHGGRWKRGESGNPQGRAAGSRNRATVALDALGADAAPEVLGAMIARAKAGDVAAAAAILNRVWPVPRGRSVALPAMPAVTDAASVLAAFAAVTAAMGEGAISAEEAASVAAVLAQHRAAIETVSLAERIARLERKDDDNAESQS